MRKKRETKIGIVRHPGKKTYEFELIFKLPSHTKSGEDYLDALFESGCDDATISTGKMGVIVLNFNREETSAIRAIVSAMRNVKKAIPNVELIEATPDIVSLTDISVIFEHSRQYTRKIFERSMPVPIHIGNPSIWHLQDVLVWAKDEHINGKIDSSLFEIANATKLINRERSKASLA